jgi:hypothetical protein
MIENIKNNKDISDINSYIGFLVVGSLAGFIVAVLYLEYLGYVISDIPFLNYWRFLDYDFIDIATFIEYTVHFYILFLIIKKKVLGFARGFFLGNIIAIFLWTFYYTEMWNFLTNLEIF